MEEIKKIIIENKKWILFVISFVLFIAIVEDLFENEIYLFDNQIYFYISKLISDSFTIVFKIITNIGSAPVVIGLCVLAYLIFENKNYGKYMTINLVFIFLLNQLLKNLFDRPRPQSFRIVEASGYSFPSGHSMVSMAFYGFIIYLIYKNVKNQYLKWGLCIGLSLLILLIGVSRIYLGVHYASDVAAGFCLSMSYLVLYTNLIGKKVKN